MREGIRKLQALYRRWVPVVADHPWRALSVIVALALAVRLAYVIVVAGLNKPPAYDGIGYDIVAMTLLEQHFYGGYAGVSAFRPPGYPFFLAGVYALFGHQYAVVRLLQAVLDALTCALVYGIGARLFNRRVALLGALGLSVYPLQVYMVGEFYAETVSFFTQAAALYLAVLLVKRRHWALPLGAGLLMAATVLTRPTATLWIPLMLLWTFLLMPLSWRERVRDTVLVGIGLALLFGPWTLRNYLVFHEFIPIASLGGVGFWAGNNPLSDGGGMLPSPETWGPGAPEHGWDGWEGLTEYESGQRFMERGLTWIKENPLKFVALVPRKLLRLWSPTAFGVQFSRRASPLLTAVVLPPYLLFLGLVAAGMVLARRGWREQAPLYALILGINALVALTYGATRYGIGMAPCLCLYAAVALDALFWNRVAQP